MTTMSVRDRERKLELYYMAIALLTERRSKDPIRKVGACIVDERGGTNKNEHEGRVVGLGYNGMPLNCRDGLMPWTEESPEKEKLKNLYVVHAEPNAIVNMNPQSVADCAVYVTLHPCWECAKTLIQSGVSKVVYLSLDECYRDSYERSVHFLQKLKDDKEIKYDEFARCQTDSMILEIRFESSGEEPPRKEDPRKEAPRKVGSHSLWWPNDEGGSENEPEPKKSRLDSDCIKYKPGQKYIGKEIELMGKEIEVLDKNCGNLGILTKLKEERVTTWKAIQEVVCPISWEQYFMGMSIITGDLRGSEAHEGACVVNEDKRIIGLGYCRIIGKIEGVHAPITAIVNRSPVSLRDCTLYVTRFPCNECAKAIVQAGIKTVVYLDRGDADNIAGGNNPEGKNTEDKNPEGDDVREGNPEGDQDGGGKPEEENKGEDNPEGENTGDMNLEADDAGEENPEGDDAGEENPAGDKTGEENPEGENTVGVNPQGCAEQQVKVNPKNVFPGGCAEQRAKVKDKKVSPDPTEKMFDLAKVKCVSYRKCYKTDPVILDFSKSYL